MREIVLDTETTGLDPSRGDRLIEIGAIEIINHVPTGATFHTLINPQREVPEEAYRVHGRSTESLRDKPVFAAIVSDFLRFIEDDQLVIHNAEFDVPFLNAELAMVGRPTIPAERVVDTLVLARRKHPGAANSLDALCDRYRIDRSRRVKHGALLDAEILVDLYCELTGGRQRSFKLSVPPRAAPVGRAKEEHRTNRPSQLLERLDPEQERDHASLVARLGDLAIWQKFGYAE